MRSKVKSSEAGFECFERGRVEAHGPGSHKQTSGTSGGGCDALFADDGGAGNVLGSRPIQSIDRVCVVSIAVSICVGVHIMHCLVGLTARSGPETARVVCYVSVFKVQRIRLSSVAIR